MNGDGLESLWMQVEAWLAVNAPGDFKALLPGLSEQDRARLEAGLGFPIHEDLWSFLRLRGGCRPRRSSMEPGAFVFGYLLLDADGILEAHRQLVDMVNRAVDEGDADSVIGFISHSSWVPLAQDFSGDLVIVDHRPETRGGVGFLSFGDPEPTWPWSSMTVMIQDMLAALQSTTALAAVEALTPRVHEKRMLQWEFSM